MVSYFAGTQQSWEEYLKDVSFYKDVTGSIKNSGKAQRVVISRQTQEIVASREALVKKFGQGFDSLNATLDMGFNSLEKAIRETKGSIEELRSSFDYNMALVVEQLQIQNQTSHYILERLDSIHETLQSPLLTQAREFFKMGCDRLVRGLLDKALEAFLQSALKDDANFMTQMMIGKLYLYGINIECNVVDLKKAESHLLAAARFAKAEARVLPEARKYIGEALLHASISCYARTNDQLISGDPKRAARYMKKAYDFSDKATIASPQISETHYHKAKFAALLGDGRTSSASLEKAISLDENYCLKVEADRDFDSQRPKVHGVFRKLRDRNEPKVKARYFRCKHYLDEWHFTTLEAKNVKREMKELLDEVAQCMRLNTYYDNNDAMLLLHQVEQNFQTLLVHRFGQHSLSAHIGRVTALSFNSRQDYFASGGSDRVVNIWQLPENILKFSICDHEEPISHLQFSQDGLTLASVDRKGVIKLWNVVDGTEIYEFYEHNGAVHCLEFSKGDRYLAAGGYNRKTFIWDLQTGQLERKLSLHKSSVDTLVFSPNGAFIATGSPDNTAAVWDLESGNMLHSFLGCSGLASSLAFSPDSQKIIIGSNDGSVKFYRIKNGALLHSFPERAGAISWLALSPDNKKLATINYGKALQLWNTETGRQIFNLVPFSPGITSVRFSPDGTMLASSDYQDRSVKLWNVQNGKLMHVIAGNLTCNEFSRDGASFVTGDETGSLRFWGRMITNKVNRTPLSPETAAPSIKLKTPEKKSEKRNRPDEKRSTGNTLPPENILFPKTKIENDSPVAHKAASTNIWDHVPMPEMKVDESDVIAAMEPEPEPQPRPKPRPSSQHKSEYVPRRERSGHEKRAEGCEVCGRGIGTIARLAGVRVCYKHIFSL